MRRAVWERGRLFAAGHGVDDFSRRVDHVQAKLVLVHRDEGEPGCGTAEHCAFDGAYRAAERPGSVDHIVDAASFRADMLEIVDMPAEVHVHVAVSAQDGVHVLLHVKAFAVAFARFGVDGVVSYHQHPVFLCRRQHGVHP